MPLSARDLEALTGAGVIDSATAERISRFFAESDHPGYRLDITHGAYYLGTLVVLWAMGWFMAESFDRYGGLVLAVTAVSYAVAFWFGANTIWRRPGLRHPAGLLYVLAVGMVPLAVFGLLNAFELWPVLTGENRAEFFRAIRLPRIIVEVSAIAAALLVIRLRPFGLMAAGVAYALWAMSIDLAVVIAAPMDGYLPEVINKEITFYFGLVFLGVTFLVDRRTREDYAVWMYLSGMLATWGAMTADGVGSAFYAAFNLCAIVVSVLIERPLFMVFGIIGMFSYLTYLAAEVFEDSVLFPLALIAIGIAIIVAGVWYRSNRERVEGALISAIPPRLRETLPRYRKPPQR